MARTQPSLVPFLGGFAQQIGEKSCDTQSALADRQSGTSFCTILSNPLWRKVIDKADCTRMFQIGDRRVLIAYSSLRRLTEPPLAPPFPSRGIVIALSTARFTLIQEERRD